MNNQDPKRKLSGIESFFQFNSENLTEEQKNTHSIIALVSSIGWLAMSLLGIVLGVLWIIVVSAIYFKIASIGLKSSKKWMTIVGIVLYIINVVYCILAVLMQISGIV